jgi:hypothetical protein
MPLTADNADTVDMIIRKFAMRRFHDRLTRFSLRAMSLGFEARQHPLGFFKRVVRRGLRGRL